MVVSDWVMRQLYSRISCIDDSYYLGRTRAGISVALKKVRPDASIYETYVIYDGSVGRADKVKSMYRYNK